MSDIALAFDAAQLRGDWTLAAGDLASGNDLQTAVLISLFTEPGWWADAYDDVPIGCRLLELRRSKRTEDTRLKARDYVRQGLAWLIKDGVAQAVNVQTEWQAGGRLAIAAEIVKASGSRERFSWVWDF